MVVDISGIASFREFQYKHSEIYNHIPHPKSKRQLYNIKHFSETKQRYMFEQSTVFTCEFCKMNKTTDLMNYTCRLMHQHSLQARTNQLYSGNIGQNLQRREAQVQNVQTASMPLDEKEEEKPRPIPLCVCVCERAISYWTSRLRNISSCCCKVLRPSSSAAPDELPSSSPYGEHNNQSVHFYIKEPILCPFSKSLFCFWALLE